jgi:hypothetical protein
LQIYQEREDDEVIDDLNGCRSGANTIRPGKHKTGGLFCVSTLTGFIVYCKEYVHRETPTEVAQDAVTAFTTLESNRNYFERMEALGFDNMCNLQRTVKAGITRNSLTRIQKYFWDVMKIRLFVDSFHLATHVCPLCDINHEDGTCIFDTKLKKFENIFDHKYQIKYRKNKKHKHTGVNDEVKF